MKSSIAVILILSTTALGGCATETVSYSAPPQAVVPDTNVYFYPAPGHAQSPGQQDRDKYECNEWAVRQTGFDPSLPQVPPHQRMQIVAGGPPPGAAVGAGALTGAVVGASVSRPWDAGRGTLIGALAGAAIGGIVESEQQHAVEQAEAQANDRYALTENAAIEQKASQFRCAIGACLEARGYTVK